MVLRLVNLFNPYKCMTAKVKQFTSILNKIVILLIVIVFFKDQPNRYIIVSVTFKLLKQTDLKLNYGDLKQAVGEDLTAENLQNQSHPYSPSKLPDLKHF